MTMKKLMKGYCKLSIKSGEYRTCSEFSYFLHGLNHSWNRNWCRVFHSAFELFVRPNEVHLVLLEHYIVWLYLNSVHFRKMNRTLDFAKTIRRNISQCCKSITWGYNIRDLKTEILKSWQGAATSGMFLLEHRRVALGLSTETTVAVRPSLCEPTYLINVVHCPGCKLM